MDFSYMSSQSFDPWYYAQNLAEWKYQAQDMEG
jgi:hypothetical protein